MPAVGTPRFGAPGFDTDAAGTADSVTAEAGAVVPIAADASRPSSGSRGSQSSGCAAAPAPAPAALVSDRSAVRAPGLDTPDSGAADFVAPDASRPPTGAHASRGSGC
ncbi:hypothetical protein ADK86_28195 [Streptomyces sp. NRRL F-5755]|uniref:hypothetical protein n=1 Tax=Streptomyces sp. NRRL F-5755 TaxID=1519475 RepID=UPI0006AE577B|nr:hypothetical protein [Streptomyces sp. NRRL F-5755]KOT89783.1 hypothetical protein ADK86_28195 [Streptomyces sp. NRRL F-5755]